MNRYIDADVARRIIDSPRSKEQMLLVLSQAEPADVVKVVHGKWVKDESKSKRLTESIYICSACHNFEAWGETEKYNYCPNCGAKMDGGEDESAQGNLTELERRIKESFIYRHFQAFST